MSAPSYHPQLIEKQLHQDGSRARLVLEQIAQRLLRGMIGAGARGRGFREPEQTESARCAPPFWTVVQSLSTSSMISLITSAAPGESSWRRSAFCPIGDRAPGVARERGRTSEGSCRPFASCAPSRRRDVGDRQSPTARLILHEREVGLLERREIAETVRTVTPKSNASCSAGVGCSSSRRSSAHWRTTCVSRDRLRLARLIAHRLAAAGLVVVPPSPSRYESGGRTSRRVRRPDATSV